MFHVTKIVYCEWQEGGDPYRIKDKVILCLNDIGGILPGDEKNETIIFMQGRDIIIEEEFDKFDKIWRNAKGINKAGNGDFKKAHHKKKSKDLFSLNQSHPLNRGNSSSNKRNS